MSHLKKSISASTSNHKLPTIHRQESLKQDDNQSVTMAALKEAEESALKKSISFLNPDTIRWMNKRKTSANSAMSAHVLPSRALQLRDVFKSLDFDNSGAIDIDEMKDAVSFVAKNQSTTEDPIFKDPEKIVNFFTSMDTNNDGTVDFNEFLIAMTADSGPDESSGKTQRLQQSFYEFANQHRRQKILEYIQDKNIPDLTKYEEMKTLFKIQYFKAEKIDLSLVDQLNRAKLEVKNQLKEIQSDEYCLQKKKELHRAREAALYFDSLKNKSKQSQQVQSLATVLETTIPEAENIARDLDKNIRHRFAKFSLHDHNTFTPDFTVLKNNLNPAVIKRAAKLEASDIKQSKYLVSKLPPIKAPEAMRKRRTAPDTW